MKSRMLNCCLGDVTRILFLAGFVLMIDEISCRKTYPKVNPNCECGWSGEGLSNRIVGGSITVPHMFPWIAAIFYKGALHCGGALINDRYVLTAGHCIKWIDHRGLDVGLGMHDLKSASEGYVIPIERVILHEDFESDYLHDTNDIALLELLRPVRFSDTIQPICLPMGGSDYSGHLVKVAGWGRVTVNGGASRYLRQATLKVMPFDICTNTSFGDHLTTSMLCAYNDNTDACQGDSGGPLLYERANGRYELIGIVSWGIGCAQPGVPGVYVKITDYLIWLRTHTKDAVYCLNR
ncbi:trypsin-1-like [Cotesia typhae]|uniref:trypsin-1-like n=1 Tax=Cotesia typhae TaxID=2053667 RepID=UPI003D680E74